MIIYLIQVDNRISYHAYKTLEEAQKYILDRIDLKTATDNRPGQVYYDLTTLDSTTYKILDVEVK